VARNARSTGAGARSLVSRVPPPRPKGFTLVELLTVIAVLTILIAMLVPSLRRAREVARRAICASNVKALAAALTLYSLNNAGRIPLGHQGNAEFRQTDYLVNQSTSHLSRPDMHFGCLVNDKLVPNPKHFYCPSATYPLFQFDTPINPWLRLSPVDGSLNWTRFGYGTRPLAAWDPGTGWVRFGWPDRWVRDLPRYERLEGKMAIAADIVSTKDYALTHHGDGVNFATAGGSVHWFKLANFNAEWHAWRGYTLHPMDYISGEAATGTGFYDPGQSTGVWFDMDRALGG